MADKEDFLDIDRAVALYTDAVIAGTPIHKEKLLSRVHRRKRAELAFRLNQEDLLLDLGAAKRRSTKSRGS